MMRRDKYKVTDKYVLFSGSFLSNWWPCTKPILVKTTDNGLISFPTSEHIYMYLKAECFGDKESMRRIVETSSVEEAKNIGRSVLGFDEMKWWSVREIYMWMALSKKFQPGTKEYEWLMDPYFDNKIFIEGRKYDNVWGYRN